MICYIKDLKDFRTIAKYDAVSYSLSDGEDGSVVIYEKNPLQLRSKYAGCWLLIGDGKEYSSDLEYSSETTVDQNGGVILNISGNALRTKETPLTSGGIEFGINGKEFRKKQHVFYIGGCNPMNDTLELIIKHPIYAFDRPVLYDGSNIYGNLITNILNNDYGVNCSDSDYSMLYMDITNSDNTKCEIETNEYGYIIPCEVFEQARKDGVAIEFTNTPNNRLAIDIHTANYKRGVAIFGDGHSQLQSEAYEDGICAKVTVLNELVGEHHVIYKSDTYYGVNGIIFYLEVAQEISKSKTNEKIYLSARIHIEWPHNSAITESDTYSNNRFDIWYGSDTHGTQLLSVVPVWERSVEAGNHNTDWYEFAPIDNQDECTLYAICRPDGSNGTNKYITMKIDYLVPTTEIHVGPVMTNNAYDTGIYYRILNYYLNSDKSISRTIPLEERPKGSWRVYTAGSTESPTKVALGAFSGNNESHKIEFYSDSNFECYQTVVLRFRGDVLETVISAKTISDSDNRFFYKCGTLITTLTDHVRELEKAVKKN